MQTSGATHIDVLSSNSIIVLKCVFVDVVAVVFFCVLYVLHFNHHRLPQDVTEPDDGKW